jgi:hypothetical protein
LSRPQYAAGLHKSPHYAASTPADLVHEVAEIVDLTPAGRVLHQAKKAARAAAEYLGSAAKNAPTNACTAAALIAEGVVEVAEIAKEKGPGIAAGAASAARDKLAKELPFARRAEPSQPRRGRIARNAGDALERIARSSAWRPVARRQPPAAPSFDAVGGVGSAVLLWRSNGSHPRDHPRRSACGL